MRWFVGSIVGSGGGGWWGGCGGGGVWMVGIGCE